MPFGAKGGVEKLRKENLRFKTWEELPSPQERAVVFALIDTSGSMGVQEKYLARSFFSGSCAS
ncbi:MAG TPA: DUF444 family protein [Moorella mulderi]|nr:DUF444 family protein [Moorella mulderi]